ncbi:15241_t:CDS:1, partial [Dentiscutata heterogama]
DISDLYSSTYQDKNSSQQQNSYNYQEENDLKSNLRHQHVLHSLVNSHHNMTTRQPDNNSQELIFSDKQLLVNWLCT